MTDRPYTTEEHARTAQAYVTEMKILQPRGPYYFGGTCQGAMISFEMARQLEAMGDTVALLAILNQWPRENTRDKSRTRIRDVRRRLKTLSRWSASERFTFYSNFVKRRIRWVAKGLDNREQAMVRLHSEVYWPKDFTAPKLNARVSLIRTLRQPGIYEDTDEAMGWAGRTLSGVDIAYMSGEPFRIFSNENVSDLGEKLTDAIQAGMKRSNPTTPTQLMMAAHA